MRALSSPPYSSVHHIFTPHTRKTKEKLRRLPHRKRLLLKTRRKLRRSRINGRKPDSPRPTTVKSVGTVAYIPAIVNQGSR
jgi:hypothetical protein